MVRMNNLANTVLFALLLSAVPAAAADAESTTTPPAECNWWAGPECRTSPLPPEAPREGVVITVDTTANRAYLFRDGELVASGPAATGTNTWLVKGNRRWFFYTPKGRLQVLRKIVDPVWTKPDWAFVEEGKPIPPADHPSRKQRGVLGDYALDLGDGILIHGTNDRSSLGRNASHGCIRLGDDFLEQVFRAADRGTEVHVF